MQQNDSTLADGQVAKPKTSAAIDGAGWWQKLKADGSLATVFTLRCLCVCVRAGVCVWRWWRALLGRPRIHACLTPAAGAGLQMGLRWTD